MNLARLNSMLWNSLLGCLVAGWFVRMTQFHLFSPRTAALMQMDVLRLRARLAMPRKKIKASQTRLHLGCGTKVLRGWLNVDVAGGDMRVDLAGGVLPWKNNSFDVIVSQHVIEHLELFEEVLPLFRELRRVAKDGAEIWLACPDMEKVCRSYVEDGGRETLHAFCRQFPGLLKWQEIPSHMINSIFHQSGEHKNLFDWSLLTWVCKQTGWMSCQRVDEKALRARFPEFPMRDDDQHSLYLRAVACVGGQVAFLNNAALTDDAVLAHRQSDELQCNP